MSSDTTDTDDLSIEDVEIPTKTVDEDKDVEERLTSNVVNQIGPARYFIKDSMGNPIEEWPDVFDRVAKSVAIPEAVFASSDITIFEEDLAEWVIEEEKDELLDNESSRVLDEEIAPYVDYERLVEVVPDDVADQLEAKTEEFNTAMEELRFMPNSPTLMNAGTEIQQLSACFVVEPGDSMTEYADDGRASIMRGAEEAADIFRSGGGVGYPFHLLRPEGARITSTSGVSSGPMSFMQIFDEVCNTVKQGGRRRGAQMGIMHSQHPDIGRFAVAKRGEENLSNFNISVGITDEFFDAVENDESYTLVDPRDGWVDPEPFDVVPETAHFYDPEFEDAWNDDFNKPGMGLGGKKVEDNFWRDHLDKMQDPEAFEQYKDQINLELGEPMELPAGFIWQLLVDGAHNKGEPGFVNLDEINKEHTYDVEEHPEHIIHGTNPCSEQPLANYEACNLGHINLSLMVDEDAEQYNAWSMDELPDFDDFTVEDRVEKFLDHALDNELFEKTARTATNFLENVVTMSKFPLDQIEETVHGNRKIGVGLMGFHQMLLEMGIRYGSETSYIVAEKIMERIDRMSTEKSHELADDRGVFEYYEDSKWADPTAYPEWFEKHAHQDPSEWEDGYAMRNHNVTTIAPTGTTSMIGNTTGGCEPLYNVAYFKNVGDDIQGDEMLVEFDDLFLRTLELNDVDVDAVKEEAQGLMMDNKFNTVDDLETVPEALGRLFVTTEELNVEQHIYIQSAMQTYCDSAISKTLNIANDATLEDTSDAIKLALNENIKGSTIYRIDSRSEEVLTTNSTGGGVPVKEADNEMLLDELVDRIEDDEDVRGVVMGELDLVDTTVETMESEKESEPEKEPMVVGGDD